VSRFLFLVFEEVMRLLLVGSMSSSEIDSDGGVIGLTISLLLCLTLVVDNKDLDIVEQLPQVLMD
ncbi:hypothetical protein Tco_0388363, partial [Tanacetum coccineum]